MIGDLPASRRSLTTPVPRQVRRQNQGALEEAIIALANSMLSSNNATAQQQQEQVSSNARLDAHDEQVFIKHAIDNLLHF